MCFSMTFSFSFLGFGIVFGDSFEIWKIDIKQCVFSVLSFFFSFLGLGTLCLELDLGIAVEDGKWTLNSVFLRTVGIGIAFITEGIAVRILVVP